MFLVDLDLQRPQLGAYLGMSYEYGLTDYLTGQAQLEQVIYDIGIKRLAVVPNASPVETSSEHLRSARMADFVNALEAQAPRRIIIFDMPPLNVSDDVLAFAPRVDSFLLVVSQGFTARRTLDQCEGGAVGAQRSRRGPQPLHRAQRQPLLLMALDLSVVVPLFNEEESVRPLYAAIVARRRAARRRFRDRARGRRQPRRHGAGRG